MWVVVSILSFMSIMLKIISIFYRIFYSEWKRREFKSCANDVVLFPNVKIIGGKSIIIGSDVVISENTTISAWTEYGADQYFKPEIIINDGCAIGSNAHITSINSIILGKGVLLGKYVTITDNSHGIINAEHFKLAPRGRPMHSKGSVIIGDNVWIGDKATVLPGVKIGENSIIGANSVVTKSIPSNCVATGCPAVVVKYIGNNKDE
jgi:acetyltransferase-like isoleucine patch superfamily enzyme